MACINFTTGQSTVLPRLLIAGALLQEPHRGKMGRMRAVSLAALCLILLSCGLCSGLAHAAQQMPVGQLDSSNGVSTLRNLLQASLHMTTNDFEGDLASPTPSRLLPHLCILHAISHACTDAESPACFCSAN